jgi:CDP-diacylglycerol--glycerol-3-phosphate 3-phosphatidyltransferase
MIWNVPNVLTVLRLLAAPAVALLFLYFTRPWADWFALVLFVGAAATDWFDGYLARSCKQTSKFGAMLDPIADKAMVVIALMVLVAYSSLSHLLVLPAAIILFREVFVSGLREFLGDVAGSLKVTRLAKWKTAAQMVAITVLFSQGVFEHYLGMSSYGMDQTMFDSILSGETEDVLGLQWKLTGMIWSGNIGIILLWVAAALTLITGLDYFRKSLPHLKD